MLHKKAKEGTASGKAYRKNQFFLRKQYAKAGENAVVMPRIQGFALLKTMLISVAIR